NLLKIQELRSPFFKNYQLFAKNSAFGWYKWHWGFNVVIHRPYGHLLSLVLESSSIMIKF
ncbi:MAG: hypothetical protein U9M90_03865, partial [Patescibacteria group bacterium]|nr:hypothetical protein [Patescibacteria group bacterium]